jgi:hypothetical protein
MDPERIGLPLVVDAHGRYGPAAHDLARRERLLRSLELASGQLVDDGEDALTEFLSGDRVALGEISDDRRMIESLVCRT